MANTYIKFGRENASSYMSAANINEFEINCNAHRDNAIRKIDQFYHTLSDGATCRYFANGLQEYLNDFQFNLECEQSAILVRFTLDGKDEAYVTAYSNGSQPPLPDIPKLRADLKYKIENRLFQCAHRYLSLNKQQYDQFNSVKGNLVRKIQDLKVHNAIELKDEVSRMFGDYLQGTLRMVCNQHLFD